ncbi:hypothetical protein NDU88_011063 [Pleurodeles waltl]|uniref:Uncharacterized protein n=1 Tax=Pleurodeles waltl TaxID=8319 RepID=A0AAV7S2V6_PLEWA|nr:hypothetical protein NDU88_011063 [Pleurodeles waltl]
MPPRANAFRLLTPRNHCFRLRHVRAWCDVEERSRRQDGAYRVLRGLGGQRTEGDTAAQIEPCRSKTSREKKGTGRPDDAGRNGPTQQSHCERR